MALDHTQQTTGRLCIRGRVKLELKKPILMQRCILRAVDPQVPTIEILGVPVASLDPSGALENIRRLYEEDVPAIVGYANAHTLNLACMDPDYKAVLRRANMILNDGSGVYIAARVQGRCFPANLNGSDFNPQILALAAKLGWSTFFLGGRPGVAERAAHRLKMHIANLDVVGVHDGYFPPDQSRKIANEIRASRAGILMAAMGNPLQEQWLDRHLAWTGARLGVGVGAFFDFAAGIIPRAPRWMSLAGIEWLYRLSLEPRRMWRRYLLGNPMFLGRVAQERLQKSRLNQGTSSNLMRLATRC